MNMLTQPQTLAILLLLLVCGVLLRLLLQANRQTNEAHASKRDALAEATARVNELTAKMADDVTALQLELAARTAVVQSQQRQLAEHRWRTWWIKNAAESFPATDPQRTTQLRLALAAFFAPNFLQHVARLRALAANASDRENSEVAQLFVGELELAERTGETAWERFYRETGGRPDNEPLRMQQVWRDALTSWTALLSRGVIEAEARQLGSPPPPEIAP